jgi:membrane associated rhomboid family serine protease
MLSDATDELAELARCGSEAEAHELGLVVLSQRAPYWVDASEPEIWRLLVSSRDAERLRPQLELYASECRYWPPQPLELPEQDVGSLAAVSWMVVLMMSWGTQNRWPELVEWGRVSTSAIKAGEVYRPLTALFLHGDFAHLTGNLIFGAVILHLLARFTGSLRAWLGLLLAGTLGNLINAFSHFGTDHLSIGASTAVFGGLGVLVALPLGLLLQKQRVDLLRSWLIPLGTGVIFLGWFGTGTLRTDTTAHLFGFLAGLPIGLLFAFAPCPGKVETKD